MNVRPREPNCWAIRRAAPIADEVVLESDFGFGMGGLEDIWWFVFDVVELRCRDCFPRGFRRVWLPTSGRNEITVIHFYIIFAVYLHVFPMYLLVHFANNGVVSFTKRMHQWINNVVIVGLSISHTAPPTSKTHSNRTSNSQQTFIIQNSNIPAVRNPSSIRPKIPCR